MEAVRNLKANLKLQGTACGWCQQPLELGADTSVCTTCEKAHHAACWEGKAGCSSQGCVNAPLRRLDAPVPGAPAAFSAAPGLPPGMMHCPRCRVTLALGTDICPACRAITSPDGIYHGPKTTASDATWSLVFGIIGMFLCGVILGPLAIAKASSAKKSIANDPTLTGSGLATAGMVLGILGLVGWAILMMMKFGK